MKRVGYLVAMVALLGLWAGAPQAAEQRNVVLITIDGLRWQELFTGMDARFVDHPEFIRHKKTHDAFKQKYWHDTPEDRRAALMPFMWSVIAGQGQILGNRAVGSKGDVSNPYHFSYPGYNEILTGLADPRINSNNKMRNPNVTVLEWLNGRPAFAGKVRAFGSWDVFPYILNRDRAGFPVNAGFEPLEGYADDPKIALLNDLLTGEAPSPWDTVRLDAFNYHFASKVMAEEKPRVIFIAFGETDDFAHDGEYDSYLEAAHRTDGFIRKLWEQAQADPFYAGKTTFLITTDHGRGDDPIAYWQHHGRFPHTQEDGTEVLTDFEGDTQVWVAALGPDVAARGEVAGGPAFTSAQMAATVAKAVGENWQATLKDLTAPPALPVFGN